MQGKTFRYFPVLLDIRDRPCLVVGGGGVGTRKVAALLACGAKVTVVSPEAAPALQRLRDQGRIRIVSRGYDSGDLEGTFLVIGATNDQALNRRIHADAEARGMLCNIADRPESCNFILPAVVRRGDLAIAVSTSGKSPALAKHLRERLESEFGVEYAVLLTLMGAIRERLLHQAHAPEAHKPLFEGLIAGGLLEKIRTDDTAGIDALLQDILGPGFTLDELMGPAADRERPPSGT